MMLAKSSHIDTCMIAINTAVKSASEIYACEDMTMDVVARAVH